VGPWPEEGTQVGLAPVALGGAQLQGPSPVFDRTGRRLQRMTTPELARGGAHALHRPIMLMRLLPCARSARLISAAVGICESQNRPFCHGGGGGRGRARERGALRKAESALFAPMLPP